MNWNALPADLQDIVWWFCGDLRNPRHRLHKFVGTEIRLWGILRGSYCTPSYLTRQYRLIGVDRMKEILELAYLNAQRKAFLKTALCAHSP